MTEVRRFERAPFPETVHSQIALIEADHWWFRARARVIVWLLKICGARNSSILEVGCGTGFVLGHIQQAFPDAALFGSEYYESALRIAATRVPGATFFRSDVTAMVDAERFDVIGAFDVIEHIQDDALALRNMTRALKSGGVLLLTVPQHPSLWSSADESAHHVRRYTRAELKRKVVDSRLKIEFVSSFVSLLLPLMVLSRKSGGSNRANDHSEFFIPRWVNALLAGVMAIEFRCLKFGIRFPVGGSLVLVARKTTC